MFDTIKKVMSSGYKNLRSYGYNAWKNLLLISYVQANAGWSTNYNPSAININTGSRLDRASEEPSPFNNLRLGTNNNTTTSSVKADWRVERFPSPLSVSPTLLCLPSQRPNLKRVNKHERLASSRAKALRAKAKGFFDQGSNLERNLAKIISVSCEAQMFYSRNSNYSAKTDKKTIVDLLTQMQSNKKLHCTLIDCLADEAFRIEIGSFSEVNAGVKFDLVENTLLIAHEYIAYPKTLSTHIIRELHRANVFYSNEARKSTKFILEDNTEVVSLNVCPFQIHNSSIDTCHEIKTIFQQGKELSARIKQLIKKTETTPAFGLPPTEAIKDEFMRLTQNCSTFSTEYIVSNNDIVKAKEKGMLDKHLNINNNTLKVINDDQKPIHIDKIQYRRGIYFAISHPYKNGPFSLLTHLEKKILETEKYYESHNPTVVLSKIYRVVFETLAPFPSLMELLFPGLQNYHFEISDETYQQCMRPEIS